MSTIDVFISKAIGDADFRQRLISNPEATAKEAGLPFSSGAKVIVHENTTNEINVVIGGQTAGLPDEALQLLNKAQQDAAFKARLLSDPAAAIRAETGVVLPANLKICIHENTSIACHLALPAAQPPTGEMSDLELEGVAGGKSKGGGQRMPPGWDKIHPGISNRR
ncbi:MAG: NHLP leader peptide family natural product precursor [Planctomycetia bacterium]|nr:NHLP leader peptide family natural product precursor [Planctomycetia bacterium]